MTTTPRHLTDREMSEKRALQAIVERKEVLSSEGIHRLGYLRGIERGSAIAEDYSKYAALAEADVAIDLMYISNFAYEGDYEAVDSFLAKLDGNEQFMRGYFKGLHEGVGQSVT